MQGCSWMVGWLGVLDRVSVPAALDPEHIHVGSGVNLIAFVYVYLFYVVSVTGCGVRLSRQL